MEKMKKLYSAFVLVIESELPLKGAAGFKLMMRNAYFVETIANQAQHLKIGAAIMQNSHSGWVAFNDRPYQIDKVTDFILGG